LPENNLLALDDLTENDMVLRHINYVPIVNRLLDDETKGKLSFPKDFYPDENYWLNVSFPMRLVYLSFLLIYIPQKIALSILDLPLSFLQQLNLSLSVRKRLTSLNKIKEFLRILGEDNQVVAKKFSYMDLHFNKLVVYVKFASLLTQVFVDLILGWSVVFLVYRSPEVFLDMAAFCCRKLQADIIHENLIYMLGFPAGFKPNANLAHFVGSYALSLVSGFSFFTKALDPFKLPILFSGTAFGCLGFSVMLAALHDLLFIFSGFIFFMYSVFARCYMHTLQMAFTLFKLFRGRKYNVIRKKDDMVSFKASELYFGVLLISMIIFLLPTFAMFYFYVFLCVVLNILCLQVALLACQTLILEFPYFLLAWTRFDDFTLPKSIIFHQLAFKSATPILALHLKHHNNAPFTHLTSQFAKLLKAAASMKMISSIVSG